MIKKVIVLVSAFIFCSGLKAQYDAQFSQYWASKSYYNPGSVGETTSVNAFIINRQQWVGIKGAPQSLFASVDMPFNKWGKNQGLGIGIYKDKIGLFSDVSLSLDYAYKLKVGNGVLALGTQLGLVSAAFDGTEVDLLEGQDGYHTKDDPYIPTTNVSGAAFDIGMGIQYSTERYYAGLSMAHVMQPTIEFEKGSIYVGRQVYLTGGMNIPLETYSTVLYPTLLLKSDLNVTQAELTLRAEYNKKFWGGLSYRLNDALIMMAGVRFNNISIGYAYDITTSKLRRVSGGSHEVFASYSFAMQIAGNSKRKYNKSIRIL